MQKTPYQKQAKIEELESIRGIAALLIVFYHFPLWNPLLDIKIIDSAYLMVELFFVLSGFVIYSAYANKIGTSKELLRFQFLRFGRLYPVHFIFLVVFIFIEIVKLVAQSKFGITSPNSQPFRENNITAIFQHLLLIQAIGPSGQPVTLNGPAWSISVEFYTYLIFGIVVLLAKEKKNVIFFLISVVSLVLLVSQTTFGFERLLRCTTGFFIGCLTVLAVEKVKVNVPKYASTVIFASIILFLQMKTTARFDVVIYFLTAALVSSLVLSKDGYLNKMLNLKVLTWLGTISYAVYMSHLAILWIYSQILRIVLKKPEIPIHGISTPQLSNIETMIACITLVIIVLFVSTNVYRFIEKPFREKSRRLAFGTLN